MFRKSMLALTLVLAGTGCAVADTNANGNMLMGSSGSSSMPIASTQKDNNADYPSQPGPYTVIYRQWSDLAG
jgi:hypothetical protein